MTQSLTELRDIEVRQRVAQGIAEDVKTCVSRWHPYYPFDAGNKYQYTWRVLHYEYWRQCGVKPRQAADAAHASGDLQTDCGLAWVRAFGDMAKLREIANDILQPSRLEKGEGPPAFLYVKEYLKLGARARERFRNVGERVGRRAPTKNEAPTGVKA